MDNVGTLAAGCDHELRPATPTDQISPNPFVCRFAVYFPSKSFICRSYAFRPGWQGQRFLSEVFTSHRSRVTSHVFCSARRLLCRSLQRITPSFPFFSAAYRLFLQNRGVGRHTDSTSDIERHLTGKQTEPWEIICFKLYKSQLPVVEKALETAGLMLGTDKSRGYCLEMICADFLAGASFGGEPTRGIEGAS